MLSIGPIDEQELARIVTLGIAIHRIEEITNYFKKIGRIKSLIIFKRYKYDAGVTRACMLAGFFSNEEIVSILQKANYAYAFCQDAMKSPGITRDGVISVLRQKIGPLLSNPDQLCILDTAFASGKISLKQAEKIIKRLEYSDEYYRRRTAEIFTVNVSVLR